MLIDTHCHIHEAGYPLERDEVIARAHEAGVLQMICVGTSEASSRAALDFVASCDGVFAAIGVHPHETKEGWGGIAKLVRSTSLPLAIPPRGHSIDGDGRKGDQGGEGVNGVDRQSGTKLVAIGEIGLDYFYTHSPREVQIQALEEQIQLALDHNLPVIFHVREAFDDFWPILDNFHGVRGELHSFTDSLGNLEQAIARGFYIGVNGISTFTRDAAQKEMFARIPLERMLLETDAPFLTPVPFRGRINEPAFVRDIAELHATNRATSVDALGRQMSTNARALFAL